MNVHEWTPVTRDYVRIENVTVDGVAVNPADLTVALLPLHTRPHANTTWQATVAHPTDGVPSVLLAGADADPTSALVVAADRILHARVTKSGTVVTAPLARINYQS